MYIESETPINVGGNNSGYSNGMFGDNGAWWVIIFLIFALGGWNNNGRGVSDGSGASSGYVLASDFATIQRQLSDGFGDLTSQTRYIQNGLCDGFYNMNASLLNGFSGVNNTIMTNGYETRNAISGLSSQLAECCCTTQRAIDGINYNMATNTCAITNAINNSTRDIIDTQNANYRALHDELVANRIEDKNAQIAAQQNEINALRLSASQAQQNTYLINQLRPTPSPSYVVPNPYCCYNTCNYGCGSVQ